MLKTYLILTITAIIIFLTGGINQIQNNNLHLISYTNYFNIAIIWLTGLLTIYLLENTKTGKKVFDILF